MDKYEKCDTSVNLKREEKKTNFALHLQKLMTFGIGLIISSLIFGLFGIAIGGMVGGERGATIGTAIGIILALCFSFIML